MKIQGKWGNDIDLQKGQFPGWYWETHWSFSLHGGYSFRAAKASPRGHYKLYAVLEPNVFYLIGNRETLTQCVFDSEDIAINQQLLGKYFFE